MYMYVSIYIYIHLFGPAFPNRLYPKSIGLQELTVLSSPTSWLLSTCFLTEFRSRQATLDLSYFNSNGFQGLMVCGCPNGWFLPTGSGLAFPGLSQFQFYWVSSTNVYSCLTVSYHQLVKYNWVPNSPVWISLATSD